MEYREFGRTGWKVSTLMMGTMQFGGDWGDQEDADSVATLHAALDAGINFFDTADLYGFGHAEEMVGKAVAGRRDEVYIATKFGYQWEKYGEAAGAQPRIYSGQHVRDALEGSLRRLGTDYVDLYQAHNCPPEVLSSAEWWEEMDTLVQEGKVRAVGVTVGPGDFGTPDAIAAAKHPQAGAVMAAYHLLSQNPARVAFPYCRRQGVGVIARGPLAMGLLTGAYDENTVFAENDTRRWWDRDDYLRRLDQARQFEFLVDGGVRTRAEAALRFALSNEDISTVLVGMQTPEQVAENVRVADMGAYDVDTLQDIAELYDSWDEHESKLPTQIKK
ncbi:aldo/keto reductase [Arthrobacter sulfonylureivorans]|uniref:Aldo/keto reductase n=1 Tax=Arthrobacter sulfonylureivorans TaxID=2486855 RepID=A0ABY3WA98_9MICC|nr:aldo/keto reductase [Arthrobacter sulfonylureivorans]UNK46068.1 aldo/keto reductase [Arthrobacter sulfonylureivorans]